MKPRERCRVEKHLAGQCPQGKCVVEWIDEEDDGGNLFVVNYCPEHVGDPGGETKLHLNKIDPKRVSVVAETLKVMP